MGCSKSKNPGILGEPPQEKKDKNIFIANFYPRLHFAMHDDVSGSACAAEWSTA